MMNTRTWFITGCSSGFGRALAQALLRRGEQVVITARRAARLASLTDEYAGALALNLDITCEAEIEAAVKAAVDRFGAIDVLVNNAGCGSVGTVEQAPLEAARAMMETNYYGTLSMIRAVLPHMIQRSSGQIVNIGSVAGQVGFPLLAHYCASKFALAGMSESLAAEVRPLGIAVTLAELGPFATDFSKNMTFHAPAAHYDAAALSRTAGNAAWGAGEDPGAGAEALLTALNSAQPPVRIMLGRLGVEAAALHAARRATEREQWLAVSCEPHCGISTEAVNPTGHEV